jgi:hypothetical protein
MCSVGSATINANAPARTANELDFTGAIADENLWFQRSGNVLKIDLIGTSIEVDVSGLV